MNSAKRTSPSFLNRYTTLPVLFDILSKRSLTLLSPATWEDRNDAYFMERYKTKKRLTSVLALCFSNKRETFHHWKVFSQGFSGVCIKFDRQKLIEAIPKTGFKYRDVKYENIITLERSAPLVEDLPFIKRTPYADEGEFRIIYQSKSKEVDAIEIPLTRDCVNRVTLSPWLPRALSDSVITTIRAIDDCGWIKVQCSTLIENERWKASVAP